MSIPGGVAPDLAGFAERQAYLRDTLGRDVRLYGPAEIVYDPTIPASEFDDEGIPLDPLAGASAVASAAVGIDGLTLLGVVRCNVVFQPLSTALIRRDQITEQAASTRATINKDLIIAVVDKPMADAASYFMVGTTDSSEEGWTPDDGSLWKVVNVETDGFGALQRAVVYGEGTR